MFQTTKPYNNIPERINNGQWKFLLYSLGVVLDPSETRLITFDLYQVEPHLPFVVAFQVLITIKNLIIHHCIIDEGASTCVMLTRILNKLGSPELTPYFITLRAYDG